MPQTVSYPGVYLEEESGLSLSVTAGATAVPVFATDKEADYLKSKRVDSWLDFVSQLPSGGTPSQDHYFDKKNVLHLALKTYFENGGGRCYVIPVGKFVAEVSGLDDITLLVQAGSAIAGFKAAVSQLCKAPNTFFAIFDGPKGALAKTADEDLTKYDSSPYAAIYYPWLTADWANETNAGPNLVPPSAAVAGVYCSVDRERGVWKAPANVSLKGGVSPVFKVSDTTQGDYNKSDGMAINMIREFRGTGPLVWGARTLDTGSDNWRYVPVRRLFNAAEKDIKSAMSFAVFEPNSQPTWERVRAAISSYLHDIWRQGGLSGDTPEQAYFVHLGKGVTMTDAEIKAGKMIVKVGMAAVRPAEFIVLKFTQDVVPA